MPGTPCSWYATVCKYFTSIVCISNRFSSFLRYQRLIQFGARLHKIETSTFNQRVNTDQLVSKTVCIVICMYDDVVQCKVVYRGRVQ